MNSMWSLNEKNLLGPVSAAGNWVDAASVLGCTTHVLSEFIDHLGWVGHLEVSERLCR